MRLSLLQVLFSLLIFICFSHMSYAAFPVAVINKENTQTGANAKTLQKLTNASRYIGSENKTHRKRRGIAILLCLLFGWCRLHRLYLGYWSWDDLLEYSPVILGILSLTLGMVLGLAVIFPGSKNLVISAFLAALLLLAAGLVAWELIDLFKLCFGRMKPRSGKFG